MTKPEINALEARYKAMALLLLDCGLFESREIEKMMEYGHIAFDSRNFKLCVKILDIVSVEVISLLEIPNDNIYSVSLN